MRTISGRPHLLIYKANGGRHSSTKYKGAVEKDCWGTTNVLQSIVDGLIPSRTRYCTRSLFVARLNKLFKTYSGHIALAMDGVRSNACLLSYSTELPSGPLIYHRITIVASNK